MIMNPSSSSCNLDVSLRLEKDLRAKYGEDELEKLIQSKLLALLDKNIEEGRILLAVLSKEGNRIMLLEDSTEVGIKGKRLRAKTVFTSREHTQLV